MADRPPQRRPKAQRPTTEGPRVRRGTLRVQGDVAWRLRVGHPWVFREALGGRPLNQTAGDSVDIVDETGAFVARGLYDPMGPIALRIYTRDPLIHWNGPTVHHRVRQARLRRTALLEPELTAHRVLHGEGDGIPGVTVDRFGDFLVVHMYSAAMEPHEALLLDALESVWKPTAIYAQRRFRPQTGEGPRAPAELLRGTVAPVEIEVRESNLTFAVDVTAPLGSGLFPDLRLGRRAVGRMAHGRRVLNLFSYTGAFSLYAAKGGAREVVSVDLASKAHARARRNLQLNGLGEDGHEFVAGDALKVLVRMAERKRQFDLVVLDPPSFSQAGKGQVFVAQKDYRDLVTAVLAVLAPDGILACSSNTAKLPPEEFDRMIGEGAYRAGRPLSVIERCGLPQDYPIPAGFLEGNYLKFALLI